MTRDSTNYDQVNGDPVIVPDVPSEHPWDLHQSRNQEADGMLHLEGLELPDEDEQEKDSFSRLDGDSAPHAASNTLPDVEFSPTAHDLALYPPHDTYYGHQSGNAEPRQFNIYGMSKSPTNGKENEEEFHSPDPDIDRAATPELLMEKLMMLDVESPFLAVLGDSTSHSPRRLGEATNDDVQTVLELADALKEAQGFRSADEETSDEEEDEDPENADSQNPEVQEKRRARYLARAEERALEQKVRMKLARQFLLILGEIKRRYRTELETIRKTLEDNHRVDMRMLLDSKSREVQRLEEALAQQQQQFDALLQQYQNEIEDRNSPQHQANTGMNINTRKSISTSAASSPRHPTRSPSRTQAHPLQTPSSPSPSRSRSRPHSPSSLGGSESGFMRSRLDELEKVVKAQHNELVRLRAQLANQQEIVARQAAARELGMLEGLQKDCLKLTSEVAQRSQEVQLLEQVAEGYYEQARLQQLRINELETQLASERAHVALERAQAAGLQQRAADEVQQKIQELTDQIQAERAAAQKAREASAATIRHLQRALSALEDENACLGAELRRPTVELGILGSTSHPHHALSRVVQKSNPKSSKTHTSLAALYDRLEASEGLLSRLGTPSITWSSKAVVTGRALGSSRTSPRNGRLGASQEGGDSHSSINALVESAGRSPTFDPLSRTATTKRSSTSNQTTRPQQPSTPTYRSLSPLPKVLNGRLIDDRTKSHAAAEMTPALSLGNITQAWQSYVETIHDNQNGGGNESVESSQHHSRTLVERTPTPESARARSARLRELVKSKVLVPYSYSSSSSAEPDGVPQEASLPPGMAELAPYVLPQTSLLPHELHLKPTNELAQTSLSDLTILARLRRRVGAQPSAKVLGPSQMPLIFNAVQILQQQQRESGGGAGKQPHSQ